jgi:hypothetical protein
MRRAGSTLYILGSCGRIAARVSHRPTHNRPLTGAKEADTSSRLWSYMPRDAHTHRIAESQELRSGRRDRNPVVSFPLEGNTSLQDLRLLTEGEFRANSIDTRMKDPLPGSLLMPWAVASPPKRAMVSTTSRSPLVAIVYNDAKNPRSSVLAKPSSARVASRCVEPASLTRRPTV